MSEDTDMTGIHIEMGQRHLVQFERIPTQEEREALEKLGVKLLSYVPDNAWWMRFEGDPSAREALKDTRIAGGLTFAKPGTAGTKLHSVLKQMSGPIQASVHWFQDISESERQQAQEQLKSSGVSVQNDTNPDHVVVQASSLQQLQTLARVESVQWIQPIVTDFHPDSQASLESHRAVPLQSAPYGPSGSAGLSGQGVEVAVFDSGFADWNHLDLTGRVLVNPALLGTSGQPLGNSLSSRSSHATHMAGLIAGSGAGNSLARGFAPAARIHSYYPAYTYGNLNSQMRAESERLGWKIANHSYSEYWPCDLATDSTCRTNPLWSSYLQLSRDSDSWASSFGVLSVTARATRACTRKARTSRDGSATTGRRSTTRARARTCFPSAPRGKPP